MKDQKEYAVTMRTISKGKYQFRQKYPDPLLSTPSCYCSTYQENVTSLATSTNYSKK